MTGCIHALLEFSTTIDRKSILKARTLSAYGLEVPEPLKKYTGWADPTVFLDATTAARRELGAVNGIAFSFRRYA